jgi:hypothetical protein
MRPRTILYLGFSSSLEPMPATMRARQPSKKRGASRSARKTACLPHPSFFTYSHNALGISKLQGIYIANIVSSTVTRRRSRCKTKQFNLQSTKCAHRNSEGSDIADQLAGRGNIRPALPFGDRNALPGIRKGAVLRCGEAGVCWGRLARWFLRRAPTVSSESKAPSQCKQDDPLAWTRVLKTYSSNGTQ